MIYLSLGALSAQPAAFYLSSDCAYGDRVLAQIGDQYVIGRWKRGRRHDWILTDRHAIRITGRVPFKIVGAVTMFEIFKPFPLSRN